MLFFFFPLLHIIIRKIDASCTAIAAFLAVYYHIKTHIFWWKSREKFSDSCHAMLLWLSLDPSIYKKKHKQVVATVYFHLFFKKTVGLSLYKLVIKRRHLERINSRSFSAVHTPSSLTQPVIRSAGVTSRSRFQTSLRTNYRTVRLEVAVQWDMLTVRTATIQGWHRHCNIKRDFMMFSKYCQAVGTDLVFAVSPFRATLSHAPLLLHSLYPGNESAPAIESVGERHGILSSTHSYVVRIELLVVRPGFTGKHVHIPTCCKAPRTIPRAVPGLASCS